MPSYQLWWHNYQVIIFLFIFFLGGRCMASTFLTPQHLLCLLYMVWKGRGAVSLVIWYCQEDGLKCPKTGLLVRLRAEVVLHLQTSWLVTSIYSRHSTFTVSNTVDFLNILKSATILWVRWVPLKNCAVPVCHKVKPYWMWHKFKGWRYFKKIEIYRTLYYCRCTLNTKDYLMSNQINNTSLSRYLKWSYMQSKAYMCRMIFRISSRQRCLK